MGKSEGEIALMCCPFCGTLENGYGHGSGCRLAYSDRQIYQAPIHPNRIKAEGLVPAAALDELVKAAHEEGALAMAHYYHGEYASDEFKKDHGERALRPEHLEWAKSAQMTESARVKELEKELAKVTEERDLAIAHDRQPYPTQWAYDQACKALEKAKVDRDAQAALVERMGLVLDIARALCKEVGYIPAEAAEDFERIGKGNLLISALDSLPATPVTALQEFKEQCWRAGIEAVIDVWLGNSRVKADGDLADKLVAELKKEGR